MVQFIKQEAEEKANEIRVAAEEVCAWPYHDQPVVEPPVARFLLARYKGVHLTFYA